MVGLTTATEVGLTWAVVLTRAGGESGVIVVEAMGPSKRPLEPSSLFSSRLAMNLEKSMGSVMKKTFLKRGATSGILCGVTSGDLLIWENRKMCSIFEDSICNSF